MKLFDDISHIAWLFKQIIVLYFTGDTPGSVDAWQWIKFHWNYSSKRIK